MRWIIGVICSLYLISGISEIVNIKADNFAQVAKFYKAQAIKPQDTLLVFDIDNTLVTMTQPLGGVGWWDWQSDLLKKDPTSPQLFAHNFQDLIKTQGILFQLIKMQPTDPYVVNFIRNASNEGATMMSLTSRGNEFIRVTVDQLTNNKFLDDKSHLIFKTHGLLVDKPLKDGALQCKTLKRPTTYQNGILFLSGADKGLALKCILEKANKHFYNILYVDDSEYNINSIKEAFAHEKNIRILNVLYTHEHKKEKIFAESKKIQLKTFQQWQALINPVHSQ